MPGPLGAAIGAVVGVAGRALATRGAQAAAATAGKELTEEAAKRSVAKLLQVLKLLGKWPKPDNKPAVKRIRPGTTHTSDYGCGY